MALSKLKATINAVFNRTYPFTMERCKVEQPDKTMKPIVFHVLPGTVDNLEYRNAAIMLSMAEKDAPQAFDQEKNETRDIEIFAKHIVRGWENVYDDDGEPVPYSEEVALELLNIVRAEFYKLRRFVLDGSNFGDVDINALTKK